MNLIKLPGPRWINLERVNQAFFFPDTETCRIEWATGDAPACLKGSDAIAFVTALDRVCYVDASDLLAMEQDGELWVGTEYDID
jgi:hypothetical protein